MTTPSPATELYLLAFEAGRSGIDWLNFTFRDDVEKLVDAAGDHDAGCTFTRAAFEEFERGRREHLVALLPDGMGWIRYFTTAPADFDTFGTETIETSPGARHGRDLREVAINPQYFTYQTDRYWSGAIYFVGPEDPRIADAEERAKQARWFAEREARAAAVKRSRDTFGRFAGSSTSSTNRWITRSSRRSWRSFIAAA